MPIFDESEVKQTFNVYDDSNNPYLLTQRVAPNGAITNYTYKANSDLQQMEDPGGNITQYFYAEDVDQAPIPDKHRHLLRKIQRADVTVREGTPSETVETYDPTEFQYDSNGNLTKIIDAKGNETVMTYTTDGMVDSIKDRNGHTTEFVYESSGYRRLTDIKVPKGLQTNDGFRKVTFAYNDSDNPDNVTSVTDDLGNVVTTEYDAVDRVVKVTDARGKIVEYDYIDGLLDEITLPANNTSGGNPRHVNFTYNAIGLLTEINRDISSSTQQMRVKYSYNQFFEVEKLIRLKNSVESSFTINRDALGRPLSVEDPLGQITETDWQTSCYGNSATTARGIRRILSVDMFCRPSMVEAGDPDSGDEQALSDRKVAKFFYYDELGRLVKSLHSTAFYGQAIYATDRYTEKRTYVHDELDRLVEMTIEGGKTFLWEYDPEGNVTKMTDPEGKVTRYEYFRDNLLHKVIIERPSEADRVFTYSYDAAGRLDEIQYPSSTGITAIFRDAADTPGSGFDENGNIRFLRYEKSGGTDPLRSFEWAYDDSNNRESMLDVDSSRAVKWEYGFDWLDRLVTVKRDEAPTVGGLTTAVLQREYVFDESDNRTFFDDHVNGVTYHYKYKSIDDGGTIRWSDQLEEILIYDSAAGHRNENDFVSFEAIETDADGNMTKRTLAATGEEISMEWTDFDRLKAVDSSVSGHMQDSRYNIDGLRHRKTDKNGNSSEEYGVGISTSASAPGSGSSAAPSISYISGHMIMGAEIDGTFVFHLGDALSTVRDVVDDTGAVIKSFEFDEYGNLLNSSGSGSTSPKTWIGGLSVNDDRADSGMFNMGHRNYAAGVLGRFISRDPIGHAGNLNLYAYPTNPVSFVDPEGLKDFTISGVKYRIILGDADPLPSNPHAHIETGKFAGCKVDLSTGDITSTEKGRAGEVVGSLKKKELRSFQTALEGHYGKGVMVKIPDSPSTGGSWKYVKPFGKFLSVLGAPLKVLDFASNVEDLRKVMNGEELPLGVIYTDQQDGCMYYSPFTGFVETRPERLREVYEEHDRIKNRVY